MDSTSAPREDGLHNDVEEEETDEEVTVNGSKRKDIPGTSTASSLPSKSKKKGGDEIFTTRSPVWAHFNRPKGVRTRCFCKYCDRVMQCSSKNGTSTLKAHLRICKQHNVWLASRSQTQTVITPDDGDNNIKLEKVSKEVFKEAANEMLVLAELPLSFIHCLGFRHFCKKVHLYTPHSRRTATKEIVEMYVQKKEAMRTLLNAHKQRVSLTTYIWVAPATGASYMVITSHFVDTSWTLRKIYLGFKHISDHTGSTIATVLLECLADWGIEKVFTITVDNATANINALEKFMDAFREIGGADALVLDGKFMHMRCCAHILNLIVKDGFRAVTTSVAAIRNAVVYVRASPHRVKAFDMRVENAKVTRGSLSLDCKTRWNSTYLMLTRAIKFKIGFERTKIEDLLYGAYFRENVEGIKRIGPPLKEDFDAVERLVKFLGIYYQATLVVSASSTLNALKCYNEIATVERNLVKLSFDDDEELRKKASVMREKFDKYSEGLKGINRLLIIASILDPRNKMKFATLCFESLYGKDTIQSKDIAKSVKTVMENLFSEYSNRIAVNRAMNTPSQSHGSQEHAQADDLETVDLNIDPGYERMDFVYQAMVNETGFQDTSNELELYLKENIETPKIMLGTEYDVLDWWKRNSLKFPVLSEIARDVLAMQVSSVASESAFSTSGRVLEPSRSCLTHHMIEVLMCTDQWLKCEIKFDGNGREVTTQQMMSFIELQDELQNEFNV